MKRDERDEGHLCHPVMSVMKVYHALSLTQGDIFENG